MLMSVTHGKFMWIFSTRFEMFQVFCRGLSRIPDWDNIRPKRVKIAADEKTPRPSFLESDTT